MIYRQSNLDADQPEIEVFEEACKASTVGVHFEFAYESLFDLGFIEPSNPLYEEPEKKAPANNNHGGKKGGQGGGGGKPSGGKKGPGPKGGNQSQNKQGPKGKGQVQMLDEEELLIARMNEIASKVKEFGAIAKHLYISAFSTRIAEFQKIYYEIYFEQVHPVLKELCKNQEYREPYFHILISLFHSHPSTRNYYEILTDISLRMCENLEDNAPGDESNAVISRLLKSITHLQTANEPVYMQRCLTEVMIYLMDNQGFDIRLKMEAVGSISNLIRSEALQDYQEQVFNVLLDNCNLVSQVDETSSLLEFLMKKLNSEEINYIFDKVLEMNDRAILVWLRNLCAEGVKLKFSFDIFMKLHILTREFEGNESILAVVKKILAGGGESFGKEDIDEYDLEKFVRENTKQNIDTFCQLCSGEGFLFVLIIHFSLIAFLD